MLTTVVKQCGGPRSIYLTTNSWALGLFSAFFLFPKRTVNHKENCGNEWRAFAAWGSICCSIYPSDSKSITLDLLSLPRPEGSSSSLSLTKTKPSANEGFAGQTAFASGLHCQREFTRRCKAGPQFQIFVQYLAGTTETSRVVSSLT